MSVVHTGIRTVVLLLVTLLLSVASSALASTSAVAQDGDSGATELTVEDLRRAAKVFGLEFTDAELEQMLEGDAPFADVDQLRSGAYETLRQAELANDVPPALYFRPVPPAAEPEGGGPVWSELPDVARPDDLEEVAFWPIRKLAALLRSGQVTSVELTRMYLERLKRHDDVLHAVVTLTEERALEQARARDRELARGEARGPLHGIPWGGKDLLAVPGYRTTWGAAPYRDQVIDETATVVSRLDSAGAVLVAKLTLGALAWGDVWYADTTRNPWNPDEGSSGSSAGSAAAVSAGLVPFAIGTETLGSIVSPSTRTGVTGLRPSFGRVSRHGAMALSWSMDKIGPICRYAEDCAMVFDAIRGPDGHDRTVVDRPFPYRHGASVTGMRIGYVASAFEADTAEELDEEEQASLEADRRTLEVLRELGAELVPIELPDRPAGAMGFVLSVEAAAAFDELTRSDRDSLMVRQEAAAWPNVFRSARFIPAVEYLQANRLRTLLGRDMRDTLAAVDAYVSPSFRGSNLLVTNLTGQPCVVVPNGFTDPESPKSITFCAALYHEAAALEAARAYQAATGWHERRPPRFDPAGGEAPGGGQEPRRTESSEEESR